MPVKKKPRQKFYSITEAATALGVSRAAVHAAIRQRRLKARKGRVEIEQTVTRKLRGWLIDEKDLKEYEVSERHQDAGKKTELV